MLEMRQVSLHYISLLSVEESKPSRFYWHITYSFIYSNSYSSNKNAIHYIQADVNQTDQQDNPPLFCAAVKGHSEIVKILLMNDANVMHRNSRQATAFHLVVARGKLHCLQLMYEHLLKVRSSEEAKVFMDSTTNDGRTIFHVACFTGHEEIVRYLVDVVGVDTTKRTGGNHTGLVIARRKGHEHIVSILSNIN